MGKKNSTSFKKGNQAGKGRPKGAPNLKRLTKAEETMAGRDFNPVDFLIDLILDGETPPEIKAKVGIELSALINPKAKELDDKPPTSQEDDSDLPTDEATLLHFVQNPRKAD